MMAPTTAAATLAAATFIRQLTLIRDASQLKRLADVLPHFLLHVMHLLLRFDKSFGDRIGQQRVAQIFKPGDFRVRQSRPGMLLLMERAAFFIDRLVLLLGLGIAHKGIDALANALKLRLLDNGFAKFQSFLAD